MERYEEAISACRKALQIRPNHWASWLELVVTYAFAGQQEDARSAAQELLRIHPKFSLEKYAKKTLYKDKERRVEALRKAGPK